MALIKKAMKVKAAAYARRGLSNNIKERKSQLREDMDKASQRGNEAAFARRTTEAVA